MKKGTKRGRKEINAGIDRISSLPDHILIHILSFLRTKKAVHTCSLSKRWSNVWASLRASMPVLKLDQYGWKASNVGIISDEDQRECRDKFSPFVNAVLERVYTFEFLCSNADSRRRCIDWLGSKAPRGHLVMAFYVDIFKCLGLLESVFSCVSLQNLELLFYSRDKIIRLKSINLPSLKMLDLVCGELNDDLMQKLFPGCPALESLFLRSCHLHISDIASNILKVLNIDHCWQTKKIRISCPGLVSLSIYTANVELNDDFTQMLFSSCPALESLALHSCVLGISEITSDVLKVLKIDHCMQTEKMRISCPCLISLSIYTVDPRGGISLDNTASLTTVDLKLHNCSYDMPILRGLSNATTLMLHCSLQSMERLEKDICNCRTFNNLKILKLGEWDMSTNFNLVACFLKNSPNLQKLYLHLRRHGDTQGQHRQEAMRDVLCKLEYVELVKISGGKKAQDNKLAKILRRYIKNIGHLLIL